VRVAYHIQSHTLPAQLVRLIRTIRTSSPTSIVVVSHSVTAPELELGELAVDPAVIVRRVPDGYGDFSHIDRWLEAVDLLEARGEDYDWLCNISGQDYPLVPLPQAEKELAEGGADAYLQQFAVFGGPKWPSRKGLTRYGFAYARLPLPAKVLRRLRPLAAINRVQPLVRFNWAYGAVGVRRRMPIPPADLVGGSFFCSMSRECALYVRDWVRRNPALVRYFRRVLAPEEVFFQTVLRGAGRFELANDSKRYFDFRASKGNHPKVLQVADLPRMESRGAHFARKLDERVDPQLLDLLDERVLEIKHSQ
jgi:Core-2/I-Branching enzyme